MNTRPSSPTEALLVEELAICWWRLHRARREEAGIITGVRQARQLYDSPVITGLLRYAIATERAWNRALANLRTAQKGRRERPHDPPTRPLPRNSKRRKRLWQLSPFGQNEPARHESTSNPEPSSGLTTDNRQLTTEIGSVPQNPPRDTPNPAG